MSTNAGSAVLADGGLSTSYYRPLPPGMGQAVAERTYLRPLLTDEAISLLDFGVVRLNSRDPHFRKWVTALHNTPGYTPMRDDTAPMRGYPPPTRWETWGELAYRVAVGNVSLLNDRDETMDVQAVDECQALYHAIAKAVILMSGRHLQHGDANQSRRPMEVFTNCSTSPTSFALFYLLLNGSGVGRCYDDDMMLVNWDNMPTVRVVLDHNHPDFDYSQHMSVRDAKHLYGKAETVHWFTVPDDREGWARAVEMLETMTYQRCYRDDLLILDFSPVRAKDEPIMGMQGRPSSGPVPLMNAFEKIAKVKGARMRPWLQTLYIDHYLAEPVLVGGARRAARMSTKHWTDPGIMDFIEVKRPIEYNGMTMAEVTAYRAECGANKPNSFLWSSNNSVTVDADFWRRVKLTPTDADYQSPLSVRARAVLNRVAECAYGDGTGEPGLINVHKLTTKDEGMDAPEFKYGGFMHSDRYQVTDESRLYLIKLYKTARRKTNGYIVNPCGEIVLGILGAFCVIADIVPYHGDSLEEGEAAARLATRSLIRVNTMDSLYRAEVRRTNRIGVGQTGIHEFAWKFFQCGFRDLVWPNFSGWEKARVEAGGGDYWGADHADPAIRAAAFWSTQGAYSRAVHEEAKSYSAQLGMTPPHTDTTMKPSGSVSKLFMLTEGAHLPAMAFYLRWVQYRSDDPQVDEYREKGYPVRELKDYRGHVIVGFPTAPAITELGMGEGLVTAGEANMDDQYTWLKLLEAFWIEGNTVESYLSGVPALPAHGNQVSYTMKYKPHETSFAQFKEAIVEHQSQVRCVSVMPQEDTSAYEYLPEQVLTAADYEAIVAGIKQTLVEDIGIEHLDCATGACPVTFVEGDKAER
jgi:ribonucleoside-triphosphate reductase (formate)